MWQRFLWICVIVLLATSCSTLGENETANAQSPGVHFPQLINTQSVYLEARLTGELTLANGCLRVQDVDGGTLLIWDSRFSLVDEEGVISIINTSTGEVLASVGDFVEVGGGYFDDPTPLGLKEPLPENCPGSYFLVGETIKKIDRP